MPGPDVDQIGPYQVEREIGRGGMGIVYLARDSRLDRAVAIKAIPSELAADPGRLQRFEREARMLAAMNHPSIAGIYGVEADEGRTFLVLEYVEGETLADVLRARSLTIEEALTIAGQIADAVAAAHDKGIIHRDLKPGNIVVGEDAAIKVLDFGLARTAGDDDDEASSRGSDPDAPTVAASPSPSAGDPATVPGAVLGTIGYMSPEQARGRRVDRRSDIFSFGCLLYEMLTGSEPFAGETATDALAAILTIDPDYTLLPPRTPRRVRELLRSCLEKDRRRRLRDVGDAALELRRALEGREWLADPAAAASGPPGGARLRLAVVGLVAAIVVAGGLGWLAGRRAASSAETASIQFEFGAETELYGFVAISPDGRRVVFSNPAPDSSWCLWVRELDEIEARLIEGTRNAILPFWSPDGRQIAFFADDSLKRVAIDGGLPRTLCPAPNGRGGSWGTQGVIVFAPTSNGPLQSVPEDGGTPRDVTTLTREPVELAHRFPQFLADGRRFVFTSLPRRADGFHVFMGSLDDGTRIDVGRTEVGTAWDDPSTLLVTRDGLIEARRIDLRTGKPDGPPRRLALRPTGNSNYAAAPAISLSTSGAAAFISAGFGDNEVVQIDRTGKVVETIAGLPEGVTCAHLSPDGRRIVIEVNNAAGLVDLWELDLEHGHRTRLTTAGFSISPIWSPDGEWILFAGERFSRQERNLYRVRSGGGGPEELVFETGRMFIRPAGVTADGKRILYTWLDSATGWDLLEIDAGGEGEPRPLVATPYHEGFCLLSPDGRWLAYTSNETGGNELYVRPFDDDGAGRRVQVSTTSCGGAGSARIEWCSWSPDGTELLFVTSDASQVYAVSVTTGNSAFEAGVPAPLFDLPGQILGLSFAPDHESFIAVRPRRSKPSSIVVTTRWRDHLEPE